MSDEENITEQHPKTETLTGENGEKPLDQTNAPGQENGREDIGLAAAREIAESSADPRENDPSDSDRTDSGHDGSGRTAAGFASEDETGGDAVSDVAMEREAQLADQTGPDPAGASDGSPALGTDDLQVPVVGVKFRRAGKNYFFNAGPQIFNIGEHVIVETERGLGLARVVTPVVEIQKSLVPGELRKVIRKANWNDLERDRKNKAREKEALSLCRNLVFERRLPMKLVRVEYLHDASKAIFYFTADHRVDFRDLVKELARQLHTRIEMRQIGVRDETKLIGGIGPCGREVCCSKFLTDFSPVSVRMAKDQNLAMNPAKVSGLCGRLMCCLAYEHTLYQELIKKVPKKGKKLVSPEGPCRVIDVNVLVQKALVELENGDTKIFSVSELLTQAQAEEMEARAEETEEIETPDEILESDDPRALEQMESLQRRSPAPEMSPRQQPPKSENEGPPHDPRLKKRGKGRKHGGRDRDHGQPEAGARPQGPPGNQGHQGPPRGSRPFNPASERPARDQATTSNQSAPMNASPSPGAAPPQASTQPQGRSERKRRPRKRRKKD